LGSGSDFEDKQKRIELPLDKEGAYLVMIRGENLHTSGIVLVSPLEIEVTEESVGDSAGSPGTGRVRITVRTASRREAIPKVEVKAIGSQDPQFTSGETDLRGVFLAEGLNGVVTVVARKGANQYAFYRGTRFVGGRPQPNAPPTPGQDAAKTPAARSDES